MRNQWKCYSRALVMLSKSFARTKDINIHANSSVYTENFSILK